MVADQVGAPTSAATIAAAVIAILARNHDDHARAFRRAGGLLNIAASSYTSWHGFASAIVDGMCCRGMTPACRVISAISSSEYPVVAARPHNSRLSLERLARVFAITMPHWHVALEPELDALL